MNLKSKILAAGLAAIIAGFGIFAANISTAQAQTDNDNANSAIAQMMQMIEALKQQIQQIIALIAQLKPQETCGNGKCRFGETAATCPADCDTTTIVCAKEGETISPGNNPEVIYKECCFGLTPANGSLWNGQCVTPPGGFRVCVKKDDGICATGENSCNSPADCAISTTNCAKEGEIAYWNTSVSNVNRCCGGLSAILDCASSANCSKSANSICTFCGNGTCGTGENSYNCPADCQNTTSGGNCNYKTYAGTCLKTGTSADGISYTFTPFQTPDISGTFLTSASQINPYRGITDTWQIANLTQTSCELKVIASGTCTPIIMRLVLSFD